MGNQRDDASLSLPEARAIDGDGSVPLQSVIITDALTRRASRAADHEAENRALATLMQHLAGSSPNVLQELVEIALTLCRAHSAGVSILEEEAGAEIFRWHAVAGQWSIYLGGTMPRALSPCGTVLDRDCALLMSYPERHFSYAAEVTLPIAEALLVPFRIAGTPVGTIWVIAHDDTRHFDREDERLLSSLAQYASTAYQVWTSQEALRAADRAKDEFLAMLGHELRNPLGALASATRVLESEGHSGVDAARARRVIGRQLDHLARLVDDLLDVSRLTTGKVRLNRRAVDLAQVARHAVEALQARGALAHHQVTWEADPVWIDADETRVEQIIANLVGNALKFTPPGGAIAIAVRRRGSHAVLSVTDSGIGIPPGALKRIFEPFFQAERSADRAHGGLGLGLALVRRLVELHGGAVQASSGGPGTGSVFTVHLPAVAAPPPETSGPAPDAVAGGHRRRLLIVEDNDDARLMLRIALTQAGHEVHEAVDGPSGCEAALALKPDVALIDVGLPGLDGYEVARRIRAAAESAHIYLVALTGYGQPEDRRQAQDAGFDEYIVKPVDPARLARLLAHVGR